MKDDQRVMLTKRLLKEGLLELLKRKPLEKINVSELCKASGINRATFYRHYEFPRDVLHDVERELVAGIDMSDIRQMTANKIEEFSNKLFQYLFDHADVVRVLLVNRSDEELTRSINEMCTQILALQKEREPNNAVFDEDSIRLISACSLGGIYFLLHQWLLKGVEKTPQEITQLLLHMIKIYS